MSNLAYKYISQGFMADAEKLLKMAQQEKDVHPNVAEAMASIAKQKNSETEKKVEINKVGIKQKNFLKFYADLRFTPKHQEGAFNGKWRFGSEIINIEEKNNTLSAEWGKAPNKQKLQGNITGNSAEITLENQVSYITTYESFTKGNNGLCYIDSNRKTIHIMTLAKYKPKFMEFVLESE
jgi:hypothetical protein